MELLPCAFCGNNNIELETQHYTRFRKTTELFRIICNKCFISTSLFKTKEDAIKLWNTRHSAWISVRDRLPIESTPVLTGNKYGLKISYLFDNKWNFPQIDNDIIITHWMPIPPSPKETE